MKLNEFIEKLQAIESEASETNVTFQSATITGIGYSIQTLKLFDVSREGKECYLIFGEREEQASEYKEQVKALKEQELELRRKNV